jgi:hypothetical protein
MEVIMSFFVATVIKWDGFEGLAEDGYGDVHKIDMDEVNPEDVLSLNVGSRIVIPEEGYIELSSSSFLRWTENTNEATKAFADEDTEPGY